MKLERVYSTELLILAALKTVGERRFVDDIQREIEERYGINSISTSAINAALRSLQLRGLVRAKRLVVGARRNRIEYSAAPKAYAVLQDVADVCTKALA